MSTSSTRFPTDFAPALTRIVRRETHSPRTTAMIVAVVLAVVGLVYVGVEAVLAAAGRPPLLVSPGEAIAWVGGLPAAQPAALVIAGSIVVAVVGLALLIVAITPGRLPKHELSTGSHAVVVDNGVLAAALARHIGVESGFAPADVRVGVAHRSVDVTIVADGGIPVDTDAVRTIVREELSTYGLTRPVAVRVRVDDAAEKELAR